MAMGAPYISMLSIKVAPRGYRAMEKNDRSLYNKVGSGVDGVLGTAPDLDRARILALNKAIGMTGDTKIQKSGKDNVPVWTVSELTQSLRNVVEDAFPRLRVRGEISGLSTPPSGHVYCDLKDDKAVLNAVCWKGQKRDMFRHIEDGMEVMAVGRLTTYGPRSRYQLVIETLAPAGRGAILAMIEKRRVQLAAEGLFDEARKKPIPLLPERVGVITSDNGAVIHDILHRLDERFPRPVTFCPVPVQGDGAAKAIVRALAILNRLSDARRPDVIIVARGGGSFEDLMAFQDEDVARAIAASDIPVVSAIGHESDTTIADYAADKRAPTPSAAAEMVVPVQSDLIDKVAAVRRRMDKTIQGAWRQWRDRHRLHDAGLHRGQEKWKQWEHDFSKMNDRLRSFPRLFLQSSSGQLSRGRALLRPAYLQAMAKRKREDLATAVRRLGQKAVGYLACHQNTTDGMVRMLRSLSYKSTLKRGYAVVRHKRHGGQSPSIVARGAGLGRDDPLVIEFCDTRRAARVTDDAPDPSFGPSSSVPSAAPSSGNPFSSGPSSGPSSESAPSSSGPSSGPSSESAPSSGLSFGASGRGVAAHVRPKESPRRRPSDNAAQKQTPLPLKG